jgi:predicted acetyltransferase
MEVTVPRAHSAFREPFTPIGRARIVTTEEALAILPGIYDRVRARTPGMLTRTAEWWKNRRMLDLPERRHGGGVLEHMVLEIDGKPEAYALYRMHFRLEHDTPAGKVDVLEVIGATPDAVRSITRLLLDIDWTAELHFPVMPVDHPLRLLLAEPRRASFRLYDTLWVRLVDVAAAMSARSYASDDAVVLDVRDRFCTWNEGRYAVARKRVSRTDEAADLSLDVSDLGAAYLGGFTFTQLAESGRVTEHCAGALQRADALFRVDRAPYNPEMF